MDVPIDLSAITIQTERLLLRAFREDDLADFYAYASVPGVGEMAGWPHHTSLEISAGILRSFIEGREIFAIIDQAGGRLIGSLGLHCSWANDDERYATLKAKEIGYVLAKDFWGQGLMPEAVRAVVAYCFYSLGLDALTCSHFLTNPQSARVIEKCGFTFVKEGEFVSESLGQRFVDRRYILRKEEAVRSGTSPKSLS
ncbi:MAG: N-acetyltransferase [Clostridia bacterium]|nr:N-acetyltransferase [Clostridia bacterium]